jgi:WD40 repeat protein
MRQYVFEAATGRERSSFTDDCIDDVYFSPDGKWLASCSGRDAKLRDLATGQSRSIIQVKEGFLISRVTFAADGQTLAVGVSSVDRDRSLGEVRLWDLRWGRVRAILRDPIGEVLSMAFSPNGKALVTGSRKADALAMLEQLPRMVEVPARR